MDGQSHDSGAWLGVTRSALGRRWLGPDPEIERLGLALAQRAGAPDLVGRVMALRGISAADAEAWLEPSLKVFMPDPASLIDMDKASERLARAVMKREAIALFGDYDVDGACSVALVARWLRALGLKATGYIPDRLTEGYGPSVEAMRKLAARHSLILTLDCGAVAFEPIAAAMKAGADVIVADHHLGLDEAPPCAAVVNPNRPDDDSGQGHLCAAGVAFLLLAATNRRLRTLGAFKERPEPNLLELLDLVALATVADVARLEGVNRAFVRQGLKVLAGRGNAGLAALADAARMTGPPGAYHLGYLLGPRVNAGGRVGESGAGARLLACDDPTEAAELAARLEQWNRERQAIEAEVLEAAVRQVEERLEREGPRALVWAAGEGWHPGVIGVVAGRLKERFERPALAIALEKGVGKGSGRSISGVDLGRAVQGCVAAGLLAKGGGHQMAAGLTADESRLPEALAWLDAALDKQGANAMGPRDLRLDGAVTPGGATLELAESLERAGPYGAGAPAPRIAIPSARLQWVKPAGEAHLRCVLADSRGGRLEAVAFRAVDSPLGGFLQSHEGRPVHAAGKLSIDDWGGRRRVKLHIDDMAPANNV